MILISWMNKRKEEKVLITGYKGYELELIQSNIQNGIEKEHHVLSRYLWAVRLRFKGILQEFLPFEGNLLFKIENQNIYFCDIVTLADMIKIEAASRNVFILIH
ncbi:hypothetical protein ACFQZ1_06600 [Bacillus sp. CGMCC 1.60114]